MNTVPAGQAAEDAVEIGERIKQVRRANKMTQKNFANSLGIAQGFLCAIEKGKKKPSVTLLIAMQHMYNVQPGKIPSTASPGNPRNRDDRGDAGAELRRIPLFAGGSIIPPSDYFINCEEFITMPGLPENGFAILHCGDFMAPTIRDGDIVIIDPDQKPAPGKVTLIVGQWGEPFLRRYRSKEGEVFLTADNINYSPFKPDNTTRILGVAVAAWRRINF